jgi:hypothetical protein
MTSAADKSQKQVIFTGVAGRYVRLRALTEVNGGPWTNVAELNVFGTPAWTGILAPSRAIDWSTAGVTGGIPNRTTICATIDPYDGPADTINNAIQNCPEGQLVKLNAGTFNLTNGIKFNGQGEITLRGAGPDQTFLIFSGGVECKGPNADICVDGNDFSYYVLQPPDHVADLTGGGPWPAGTTQITLSTTAGLQPGMFMVLDLLDDVADTGELLVCSVPMACASQGSGGAGRANREQEQFVRITSINGNLVTFTPGLYMPNWRGSQSPQAFWGTPFAYVSGVGVEDLSMTHSGGGTQSGIRLAFASGSWIRNVRSLNVAPLNNPRNHVWLYESPHNTVRDSYFYGANCGDQSYGIEEYMTSDNLIENNILHHIAAPLQSNTGSGSVFGYNYSFDDCFTGVPAGSNPGWQQASSYLHGAGTGMVLHEGNIGSGFEGDVVHGSQLRHGISQLLERVGTR